MEYMIRRGPEFERRYNCSFYNVSQIPLERRVNVPLGIFELALATFEALLYAPCLWSIWTQREKSCFKLMFVIGLLDIVYLLELGATTGWFQLRGYVYCMAPTLTTIVATIGSGIYLARSVIEIILASNRCLSFVSADLTEQLFPEKDSIVWWWTAPPLVYGLCYTLFGRAFSFVSHLNQWMLNPHNGYHDEMEDLYHDWKTMWWVYHNNVLMIVLPVLYAAFFIYIFKRSREISAEQRTISTISIFAQVAIISAINCFFCYLCVFTNKYFVVMPELLRKIWLPIQCNLGVQIHGVPPLIYLTLNKTIRGDVKRMIKEIFNFTIRSSQVQPSQAMLATGTVGTGVFRAPVPVVRVAPNNNNN